MKCKVFSFSLSHTYFSFSVINNIHKKLKYKIKDTHIYPSRILQFKQTKLTYAMITTRIIGMHAQVINIQAVKWAWYQEL
jgi:hypothetical protein